MFAVFVMHGLNCMDGDHHFAGASMVHAQALMGPTPALAPVPESGSASGSVPGSVPHHAYHRAAPAGQLGAEPGAQARLGAADGSGHHGGHAAAECIAVLVGLLIFALLAAGTLAGTGSGGTHRGGWIRLRPRPPTGLLRPSLSSLCVLRT